MRDRAEVPGRIRRALSSPSALNATCRLEELEHAWKADRAEVEAQKEAVPIMIEL